MELIDINDIPDKLKNMELTCCWYNVYNFSILQSEVFWESMLVMSSPNPNNISRSDIINIHVLHNNGAYYWWNPHWFNPSQFWYMYWYWLAWIKYDNILNWDIRWYIDNRTTTFLTSRLVKILNGEIQFNPYF